MKICPQCNGMKALDAFAVDRSKKDGRKGHCKTCDAGKKKKAYYAASPTARSSRVLRQRHRRWRDISETHGERWLIEQVQNLKRTGKITTDASHKAEQDARLAAFFREAHGTSTATLRTHLGSRLWDRVARPFVARKDRKAETQERREQLQARLLGTDIVGLEWNDRAGRYEGVLEGPDVGPTFASFVEREASDRVLRKGRFAVRRPDSERPNGDEGEKSLVENGSQ